MTTFGLRPGRSLDPQEQIFLSTTLIGYAEDGRFFGSCFFVAALPDFTPYVRDNSAVMFLVTAHHVVANALQEGRALCIRVPRFGADPIKLPLPADGWMFPQSGADLAILALPDLKSEPVPGGIALAAISHRQFFLDDWQMRVHDFRLGDPVRVVGMWYGETRYPQLIVRSGNIATGTIGPVQFQTGALPAYLADVTVTRAMSGGPVYATSGRGWEETSVIGVNHGFWPLDASQMSQSLQAHLPEETGDDRALRRLLTEVERLNSRLAIITPVHHLAECLMRHPLWTYSTQA